MLRLLSAFRKDQRGMALILVSVMLPVIVGFALLALDMSRANNLHNDLQKAADSFAIAGAAELDGKPDALTRADRALANLVDNTNRFSAAADGTQLTQQLLTSAGITRRFLRSLPANDWNPIVAANLTALPDEARFIEVTINPTGFASIFPASFLTGNAASNSMNVGATAVAGFGSAVCDFTPVFICNPYETGSPTIYEAAASRSLRRQQIELRSVGGGSAYFPGNFGFLDSPGGNGARALAEMIASSKPLSCYSSRGVDTKTGQNSGPVKGAFNIRFGIQEPGTGSWNSAQYGPAQNVRKGAVRTSGNPDQCSSSNQLTWGAPNQGLSADPCFATNSCTKMGGRMGDGDWDFSGYWSTNHGAAGYPAEWSTSGANRPTRYEVYRYEITHDGGSLLTEQSTGGETGTPPSQCGAPVTTVDRRLLYGAILNCQALEAAGYDLGGHEVGLPVEAFASFFMTEPVRKEPASEYDASVFVELVDVTGGGSGTLTNFLRDEVQLYR